MKKINYVQDAKTFWEARKKSREDVDRELENHSLPEMLVIIGKMTANHMAVRNAKQNIPTLKDTTDIMEKDKDA